MLGKTTTVCAEVAMVGSTTVSVADTNHQIIDATSRKQALGATLTTTGTSVIGSLMNAHDINKVKEEYSRSYVESMTDEELEQALEDVSLLIKDKEKEITVKSI